LRAELAEVAAAAVELLHASAVDLRHPALPLESTAMPDGRLNWPLPTAGSIRQMVPTLY
jgi:hypothetical protein